MSKRKDLLEVVEPNYSLTIRQGAYGFQALSGMIEITEELPEGISTRLTVLEALIAMRKAETTADPLPDEFPVLPAAFDAVTMPYKDNPSLLHVQFRPAVHGETLKQRLEMAQDIAPVVVDFVLGRFDPLDQ